MNKSVNLLCGELPGPAAPPLPPFSPLATEFLSALSARLLKDGEARAYPDVVTFAFFCRRANLEQLAKPYQGALEGRVGRGVAFHIAPSNVPINFAYSLAASLLAGNANVVKASSKDFVQTRMVCRAMKELLEGEYAALSSYACVVVYPREEQEVTQELSAACDARVIWGGDETVRRVREAPLPPRAFDVTFADRYSVLAIRSAAVLDMKPETLDGLAQGFYNDTFLTDQNACTAPRLVYWLGGGEETAEAKRRFWEAAHGYAASRYPLAPVVAVDKRTAACRAALELEGARVAPTPDNLIVRVELKELKPGMEKLRCPGGFFLEYESSSLNALCEAVGPAYQTLSYVGLDPVELRRFVTERGLRGVDRIVPVGRTLDFSLVWDGYDLIRTLSRQIGIL